VPSSLVSHVGGTDGVAGSRNRQLCQVTDADDRSRTRDRRNSPCPCPNLPILPTISQSSILARARGNGLAAT